MAAVFLRTHGTGTGKNAIGKAGKADLGAMYTYGKITHPGNGNLCTSPGYTDIDIAV